MRNGGKLMLAALLAASILGVAVGSAAAVKVSFNSRGMKALWEALEFTERGEFGLRTACPVTMEGSFHSTRISKVRGALVGHVSRVTAGTCTGTRATPLAETLPWHLTYRGFTGTLPTITALLISLAGESWQFPEPFGGSCLYGSTSATPANASLLREAALPSALRWSWEAGTPLLLRSGIACAAEVTQGGVSRPVLLLSGGSSALIAVALI
jgi:hypothetical protein